MQKNGTIPQNRLNLRHPYQPQGDKCLLQTVSNSGQRPESNSSSIRTVDSCPITTTNSIGFPSQGFSRSPQMVLKHFLSTGQTQPFSFMGSDNNRFPSSSGHIEKEGNWCPMGEPSNQSPALFHSVSQQALRYVWQDSPWKSKLREHFTLPLPSLGALQRMLGKRSPPYMKEWVF